MGEYVRSSQVQFTRSPVSCGVLEAHHLTDQGGRKNFYQIANALYHKANPRPAAFVIFSDVATKASGRGQDLADFIHAVKVDGKSPVTLQATETQVNPRTGNPIKLWVITPDHELLRKWYTEETMHRIDE